MLHNISISDKCCSSECSIHQRNLKKFYSAIFNIIIIIIIINVFEQQIRMTSEGSCYWSNDAKNSTKMLLFLLYFGSNKCRLGEKRRLL